METKNNKLLDTTLWIAQALLAASLMWAAYMKLFSATADLHAMWPWTENNTRLVLITAIVDILGGISIIGFSLVHAKNRYTIWSAYGIIALMIAASVFHISRGEADNIGINIFYMAVAAFVIWGRKKVAPKK